MSVPALLAAFVGALLLGALSTVLDFVWARLALPHRAVFGLAHGTLLLLALGLYLGALRARPWRGAAAGALVGLLAAGSFYALAPLLGYRAMFVSWMALWVGFALVDARLGGAVPAREALVRGLVAAVGSGLAFWAISDIWLRPPPGGPRYAWNFACWTLAFLPGFAALLARRPRARRSSGPAPAAGPGAGPLALHVAIALVATLAAACGRGPTPAGGRASASPASVSRDPDVAATVAKVIGAAHHPELAWPDIPDVAPVLKAVYDAEPDGLFWFAGRTATAGLAAAVAGLSRADEHGLERRDYDADRLATAWAALRADPAKTMTEHALFDLALTADVARLLAAVHVGRVDPATLQWGFDIAPKALDRAEVLRELRAGVDLEHTLALLEPPFAHYARARRALAHYRAKARRGEPEPVPPLPKGRRKIEPGAPWAGAPQLTARLVAMGDVAAAAVHAPASPEEPSVRDAEPLYAGVLVDGLKRFQGRHGLEPDGVIGGATITALNVSFAHRARQLQLAMERMRWLPKLSDGPNVFVNVALFRLWATDPASDREPLRMNVVVGKALDHRTPLFVERMEYVVFRPYWTPPYGITVKEIVPRARRDASYLAREDIEIVASGDESAPALPATSENLDKVVAGTLSVRQRPGPKNSLGLAKFIFPNRESVYMHGTPAQQLFSRARRDFSHGCIRVEKPKALAEWVLRDQPEWTPEKIEAAMQGERPARVNLKQPVTVVIFYDTVHVNSEGLVFFVEDIYGHDRQLDAALRQGYPYPTKG